MDAQKTRKLTEGLISEFDIATPGPDTTARSLSGGNLQKLILARVLSRRPRLIIANLPTQGLDVGATEFVQNKLLEAKRQHAAILLISEDLDEVLSLSDRVAPIYEGEFMGIIPIHDARIEDIGAMMAGLKQKVAAAMRLGSYEVKLEKKARVTGLEATAISLLAIVIGLALVGLIFLQAEVNPLTGYKAIFSYAFANPFGLPLTINRSVFILLCTCAFIVPMKAGLWNIGMAGQLYGGALGAFGVALAFGAKGSPDADRGAGTDHRPDDARGDPGRRGDRCHPGLPQGALQHERDRRDHDVELDRLLADRLHDQGRRPLHGWGRGRPGVQAVRVGLRAHGPGVGPSPSPSPWLWRRCCTSCLPRPPWATRSRPSA